jgi:hypothetical protein
MGRDDSKSWTRSARKKFFTRANHRITGSPPAHFNSNNLARGTIATKPAITRPSMKRSGAPRGARLTNCVRASTERHSPRGIECRS